MFRLAVILVHALLFILVTILGLAGIYNPASPEVGATYGLWISTFILFNILVLLSAFVQLKLKKVWVFLTSIIGLIIIFILTLQYIYPYLYQLLE